MGILRRVVLPLALALARGRREPGREEVRRHLRGPLDRFHRRRSRPGREPGRSAPRGGGREDDRRAGGGVGRRAVGVLPDDLADTPDRDRRRRRPPAPGCERAVLGRGRHDSTVHGGSRRGSLAVAGPSGSGNGPDGQGGVTFADSDSDADADAETKAKANANAGPHCRGFAGPHPGERDRGIAGGGSPGQRLAVTRASGGDVALGGGSGTAPRPCRPGSPSRARGPGERGHVQGQVPIGRQRVPRRGPGARPPRGRPARGRGRHGRRRAGGRVRGRAVGLVQAPLGEAPGAPGRRRPADLARPGPARAACRDGGRRGPGRPLDDGPQPPPRPSPPPTPSPPARGPACAAAPPSATTRPGTRRSPLTTSRSAPGGWTSASTTSPASR